MTIRTANGALTVNRVRNFCTLSDYKQKMQDWWKDLDFYHIGKYNRLARD